MVCVYVCVCAMIYCRQHCVTLSYDVLGIESQMHKKQAAAFGSSDTRYREGEGSLVSLICDSCKRYSAWQYRNVSADPCTSLAGVSNDQPRQRADCLVDTA